MSSKVKPFYSKEELIGYSFFCQGCMQDHLISTEKPNVKNAQWKFDGDIICPTFHPSINIFRPKYEDIAPYCCHFIVVKGAITYLQDTTHHLSGRTIEMEEIK